MPGRVLTKAPLHLQLLAQMSQKNKADNTIYKHFAFLEKAFGQRHLQTSLGPFSPKIFKTLSPSSRLGKIEIDHAFRTVPDVTLETLQISV